MCSSNTCDMYMCRLKNINDSVLSSLKMEGIRLLFSTGPCIWNFLAAQEELCFLGLDKRVPYIEDFVVKGVASSQKQ
jgi:hypothetical protein